MDESRDVLEDLAATPISQEFDKHSRYIRYVSLRLLRGSSASRVMVGRFTRPLLFFLSLRSRTSFGLSQQVFILLLLPATAMLVTVIHRRRPRKYSVSVFLPAARHSLIFSSSFVGSFLSFLHFTSLSTPITQTTHNLSINMVSPP